MKYEIEKIKNTIICGDALETLRKFPDECVDVVITSPPYYALRNYQVEGQIGLEPSFEEYQNKLLEIFKEIKRVLKKSGSFWLNIGDVYSSKISGGYGKTSWKRGGRDSKMSTKELEKTRKFLIPNKCMMMIPERIALKMIDEQGWILRQKIIWAKQILLNKEKRTIGSTMPTSAKDRFNMSWEYLYHFVKNKKYYFDLDAVRIPPQTINPQTFNYRVRDAERKAGQPQFKASEEEIKRYKILVKDKGNTEVENLHGFSPEQGRRIHLGLRKYTVNPEPQRDYKWNPQSGVAQTINSPEGKKKARISSLLKGKNIPTVWQINPEPHNFRKELGVETDHFAAFAELLCEIPIKASCPENGIVLDPFAGSGTALVVAKKLGRNYIGIDLNPNYCEIAKRRLFQIDSCPQTILASPQRRQTIKA